MGAAYIKNGQVDEEGHNVKAKTNDPLQPPHHRLGVLQLY